MRERNREITKGINTVYARGSVEVLPTNGKPTVIEIKSSSGNKVYRLDLVLGRCSCPAWIFKSNASGGRGVCKHLKLYGYSDC